MTDEAEVLAEARLGDVREIVEGAPNELPLSRNRDFLVVLIGQGLSAVGDAVTFTALPILVLALTGSGLAMGVVGTLQTLPDLLIGLPAGALADRWDRRKMMLGADVGRALLTAAIPLSVAFGGPTLLVIVLVTFPINSLRVLWLAGYTAAVPSLVSHAQVGRANSVFEAVFNLGFIIGPGIAGVLAAIIGPGPTIAVDAVSFAVSSSALLLIRRPMRAARRAEPTHLLADIRDGIAYVTGHRMLRVVILYWALVQIGVSALTLAMTYHVETDRGLGPEVLGFILSGFGLGSLVGAVVASRLVRGNLGRIMLLGTLATGVLLISLALRPPIPVVIATAFLAGAAESNVLIAYLTLRTTHSPDALLGRVGSTARFVSVGMTPLGLLAGGLLIDAADGATALAAMGAWMVLLTIVFGASSLVRGARSPAVRPTV
ncbi:MAG: MFS transporter [Candidatus Limnocylindrales bacterium]